MTQLLAEHRCLSEVLYYEARGEGAQGQKAVAEVVFHRMNAGNYGHSICAVVYEGAGHPGCQFSFTCNGDLKRPKDARAWRKAEKLAARNPHRPGLAQEFHRAAPPTTTPFRSPPTGRRPWRRPPRSATTSSIAALCTRRDS